jgi:uncharacterized membrane protein
MQSPDERRLGAAQTMPFKPYARPDFGTRFDRLDALRGVAIVWMALFHFGFDLNHYGLLQPRQNFFHDPFWTTQRTVIVSLFLFCAGLSQAVALQLSWAGQRWPASFWRRWGQIALCAVLVSLGSMLLFPKSWISFGVLHAMVVLLLLCRWAAPMGLWLWPLGAVALALPHLVQHPFFDAPWINWLGLVTKKPITEDYVPVLPWLGVMLWGLAAGQWLLLNRREVLAGGLPSFLQPLLQPLAVLGRWSLSFYMLHQPVLIGAVLAFKALR